MEQKELEPIKPPEGPGPMLKFNRDVKITENPTELDYEKVPVTNFGEKMLQRMGWIEGTGIGRGTKNALVKPIEYIPRHHRLGLGGTPIASMKINGGSENGNTEHAKSDLNSSNYKYLGEKTVDKYAPGNEVLINKGKYEGMYGRIVNYDKDNGRLSIELLANDQKVKVSKEEVSVGKEIKEKSRPSPQKTTHKHKKNPKIRWVKPGIIVRIISKEYAGGKYYNKKVRVDDVLDKRNFTLITEDKNFLDDLIEDDIETVMPHLMEDVMVVRGDNTGELGKLMMRDKKRNSVKIQLYDHPDTVINCTQDDCSAVYNKGN